jgi:hypothetical protein
MTLGYPILSKAKGGYHGSAFYERSACPLRLIH